jgi:hypothetical protein
MKFNKSIYIAIIGAGLFSSCTKDFEKINTDSRAIVKDIVKPEHIFTYAIKGFTFDIFNQTDMISNYSGYYKNPAAGNAFSNRDWAGPYNNFYRNYYNHMSEVVRLTDNIPNKSNMNAIARIMKSMIFQHITDLYGDVPYFEAALGLNTTILQPRYDKQQDIYTALLKEVKESTEKLVVSADQLSFGNADLYYKNDINKWIRFGNSLRLRMAMRIRYANPALAEEHIKEVIAKPLMTENSHNMILNTLDDGNTDNQNPLYTKNATTPNNLYVTFTTTDLLKKLQDPRLPLFARPGAMGYLGAPLQVDDDGGRYGSENRTLMANSFLSKVVTIVVMNAAEINFLRAEAANANITTENAETLYNDGIKLAQSQYGVSGSATTTNLDLPQVKLTGTEEEKMEKIINQKWIATYYNHYEAYAEFRRTGYPRIWTGNVLGVTNGEIPRRLTYPEAEFIRNEVNVQEAVGRLEGGNTLMSKVWWDKKAGLPIHHPKQGQFPPES